MATCQKCWWPTDFSLCEREEVDRVGMRSRNYCQYHQPAAMTSMLLATSPWICLQPSSSCEHSVPMGQGQVGFRYNAGTSPTPCFSEGKVLNTTFQVTTVLATRTFCPNKQIAINVIVLMIEVVVVDFVPVYVRKIQSKLQTLNHIMAKNSESINSL